MLAAQVCLEIVESQIAKDLFDDLDSRFLLEDAAVAGTGKEPKPRDDFSAVVSPPCIVFQAGGEPADETVEEPPLTPGMLDADGHIHADNLSGLDRIIVRDQIQIKVEESRHRLVATKRRQQELILSQWRLI